MTTLHAHMSTHSVDCDGPLYKEYIETFNMSELAENMKVINNFSDLHFKERILGNVVSFHAEEATVKVTARGFDYHEVTDEGFRAASVIWCEDDCDTEARSQRDVYAEQMGY